MDISFRDLSRQIDRLYAIDSLSDLITRFRLPDVPPGTPPRPTLSLRYCGERVLTPAARIEFLHYNTWLLAATFDVRTFLKGTTRIGHLVTCLSLEYADVLAKILATVPTEKICDAVFPPVVSVGGISVNPANVACKIAASAVDLAGKVIEALGTDLDVVLDLLEIPASVAIDIILETAGLDPTITIAEKPDMDARASEIAHEVFRYDWVSLCEVWDASRRAKILAGGTPGATYTGAAGPQPGDWQALGSGLLVFSTNRPLAGPATHVYQNTGVTRIMPGGCDVGAFVDSDIWAMKGVQLTTLDVGIGKVDLYSTHLYSGGDMADIPILGLDEPSGTEKAAVRAAQVDELVTFIGRTHDPRHVAILAGDFNIDADVKQHAEYDYLIHQLQNIRCAFAGFEGVMMALDDWWTLPPFTEHPQPFEGHGHTNRHGDGSGEIFDTFDSVCKTLPGQERPSTFNQSDYYCDDQQPQDSKATGGRIDFIFVERQTQLHTMLLDISRVRRRAFKRTGPPPPITTPSGTAQPQIFLSDHLGLEVTLFANLRHQPA